PDARDLVDHLWIEELDRGGGVAPAERGEVAVDDVTRGHAVETSASASPATSDPTSSAPPSPAARTRRLPTITPSAISPTARACAGVEMPKPTATGTDALARTRCTVSARPGGSSSRSPVVPASETV